MQNIMDDEYAKASEREPKILITTARDPSQPLVQFAKELKFIFPNAERMNRGGQIINEIIESCRARDFTDVILIHEHRGVPDGLIISHLPFGPTAYFGLYNVVTRHDIKDKKSILLLPARASFILVLHIMPEVIVVEKIRVLDEETSCMKEELLISLNIHEIEKHVKGNGRFPRL